MKELTFKSLLAHLNWTLFFVKKNLIIDIPHCRQIITNVGLVSARSMLLFLYVSAIYSNPNHFQADNVYNMFIYLVYFTILHSLVIAQVSICNVST